MVYGIYYYILIIYLILNIMSCIKIVYVTKLLYPIYILDINDIYH